MAFFIPERMQKRSIQVALSADAIPLDFHMTEPVNPPLLRPFSVTGPSKHYPVFEEKREEGLKRDGNEDSINPNTAWIATTPYLEIIILYEEEET